MYLYMYMTYLEEQRKGAIIRMMSLIRQCHIQDKELDKEKFVAEMSVETGKRPEKIKEYIKTLIQAGKIYEEEVTAWEPVNALPDPTTKEEALERRELIKEKYMITIIKPTKQTIDEMRDHLG